MWSKNDGGAHIHLEDSEKEDREGQANYGDSTGEDPEAQGGV